MCVCAISHMPPLLLTPSPSSLAEAYLVHALQPPYLPFFSSHSVLPLSPHPLLGLWKPGNHSHHPAALFAGLQHLINHPSSPVIHVEAFTEHHPIYQQPTETKGPSNMGGASNSVSRGMGMDWLSCPPSSSLGYLCPSQY